VIVRPTFTSNASNLPVFLRMEKINLTSNYSKNSFETWEEDN
jgi:hypothetical protein